MDVVNLTGHPIAISDGQNIKRLPSMGKARVISESRNVGNIVVPELARPLPITELREVSIVGLPEPVDGVLYVVSGVVAAHVPDRSDVVAPGRVMKNPQTREVIGCQGFVKPIPSVQTVIDQLERGRKAS